MCICYVFCVWWNVELHWANGFKKAVNLGQCVVKGKYGTEEDKVCHSASVLLLFRTRGECFFYCFFGALLAPAKLKASCYNHAAQVLVAETNLCYHAMVRFVTSSCIHVHHWHSTFFICFPRARIRIWQCCKVYLCTSSSRGRRISRLKETTTSFQRAQRLF